MSVQLNSSINNKIDYTSDYDEGEVMLPSASDKINGKNLHRMTGGAFSILEHH